MAATEATGDPNPSGPAPPKSKRRESGFSLSKKPTSSSFLARKQAEEQRRRRPHFLLGEDDDSSSSEDEVDLEKGASKVGKGKESNERISPKDSQSATEKTGLHESSPTKEDDSAEKGTVQNKHDEKLADGDKSLEEGELEDEDESPWKPHLNPVQRFLEPYASTLHISWTIPHLTLRASRPVIRSAIAAWLGLLLILFSNSERTLGQASFLVLIVAVFAPPSDPISLALEKYTIILIMTAGAWAWAVIAIQISHLARKRYRFTSSAAFAGYIASMAPPGTSPEAGALLGSERVTSGDFLETGSSVVCAVFLAVGVGSLLWFRGWLGPSPFTPALIFSIILLCITMTTAPLFPYPNFLVGWIFYLPLLCQVAIGLACTLLVFPETLNHRFSEELINVLTPLHRIIATQEKMLSTSPRTGDWSPFNCGPLLAEASAGIGKLGQTESVLGREVSFGRFNGRDMKRLLKASRELVGKTTGFSVFFDLVSNQMSTEARELRVKDPERESQARMIIHVPRSEPTTPAVDDADVISPTSPTSPDGGTHESANEDDENDEKARRSRPHSIFGRHRKRLSRTHTIHSKRSPSASEPGTPDETKKSPSHLNISLLQDVLKHHASRRKPVGLMESQKYMDLEQLIANPADEYHIEEVIKLLHDAGHPLIRCLQEQIKHLISCIDRMKSSGINPFRTRRDYDKLVEENESALKAVKGALEEYRGHRRLDVVRPFARLFDPQAPRHGSPRLVRPSHKGLFWAFEYEYILIDWSHNFIQLLERTISVEKKRRKRRLWFPKIRGAIWRNYLASETVEDEDPTKIPGLDHSFVQAPRDPDTLPPLHYGHYLGSILQHFGTFLGRPDILFGVKAGIFVTLLSLPAYIPSSASFYYHNRGLWVTIIGSLTLSQHVGDTTFGYVQRVLGTFVGGVLGLLIWSIGCGTGSGNAYGLAIICAFAFVPMFFYRIYFPIPTMGILLIITALIIVGYSWQNGSQPTLSSVGWGWDTAWRRFLCVLIGVTAAFIFAYFPPRSTQKKALRIAYSNVLAESGRHLCQVISFAAAEQDEKKVPKQLVDNWVALRAKLRALTLRKSFIGYEISLRGTWPEDQYAQLHSLSQQLIDCIHLFLDVVTPLNTAWMKAILERTSFGDPRFVGELTSAIHMMSNSLKTGASLPTFYTPLADFYVRHSRPWGGFGISPGGQPDLPQYVDFDTMCSFEYLRFAVATSFAFAIVNRLDRLMFVVKTLVGEDFRVYLDSVAVDKNDETIPLAEASHRSSVDDDN